MDRESHHDEKGYQETKLISWPDHQEQQDIAVQFQLQSQLPGVIGALDGTHIRISGAIGGDVDYINRKGFPSVQLQIVSDNRMMIRHAFTGWPGSTHDARVLRNSSLYNLGENSNKIAQDMYLLADSAYPLREWIITPFRDNGRLNQGQRRFNRALSSARQIVERCIGLLKGRFRRLREISLHLLLDIIQNIISACILHNLCVAKNDNIERFMEEPDDDPNRYANIKNYLETIFLLLSKYTGLVRRQQLMNNLP
ncbi:unnamed protein product [Mytilus edulis]|uniref:DDE Tnp4 domain-containing protein n=1 Tax=Mytilus edulis TaxID=6550 RepID=A0A8S3QPJ9_MYTED|nr:unnamed protein product [Mytilus edulis]